MIREIYRVGLPSMLVEFAESATVMILNNVLSAYGSMAIAAVGIMIRVIDFAFMPMLGLSQGLLPIVGYYFGARLWVRLWKAVRTATFSISLLMIGAMILLQIFAPQLVRIFTDDPELIDLAVPGMRIAIAALFLIAPALLFIATFQGLGKGKAVLFLSFARQLLFFVPLLYILPQFWGIYGVWIAMPVSDTIGFIVAGSWLLREYRIQKRSGAWKNPAVTGEQNSG
jgi:Na+-driven multidrug efflux pump